MASVAASSFVSRSSYVNPGYGVTSGSDVSARALAMKVRSLKQTMTHSGLRSLNMVDELHMKTMAKVTDRQARKKRSRSENGRPVIIVCQSGMNIVFVGTEVGPWSKTGGLGDVLGGLPPAMAVSLLFLFSFIY